MSEQTDKYRRNAEEARQQAEKCVSVMDKESWLNIEKGWLQLAHEAEKILTLGSGKWGSRKFKRGQ